jgi:hypothetical protein
MILIRVGKISKRLSCIIVNFTYTRFEFSSFYETKSVVVRSVVVCAVVTHEHVRTCSLTYVPIPSISIIMCMISLLTSPSIPLR